LRLCHGLKHGGSGAGDGIAAEVDDHRGEG
jgi:hypothetical protein